MKILWVKAGKLLPVDTGGKIRSFNLLRELDARSEVTLLSYYSGSPDLEYERGLAEAFPRAVPVHTGAPDGSLTLMALDYAARVLSPAPYAVTKFTSAPVRRLVARWDAERRFDVTVCDFLSASLNCPRRPVTPAVLFQHNVESILWRRQAETERHPIKRAIFRLEAAKMDRYERRALRNFEHVIAVSDHDRDVMAAMTSPDRLSVVPTGVDIRMFQPPSPPLPTDATVLFLGSMDWEANIDGVGYFCDEMWPIISAAVPDARFQIVGRNPAPAVARLASENVEVIGTVPSVVKYLHRAAVVVVPLRVGGGTRLKIYEAMAAGRAVVSTTIGAEGLDVTHGRDILLADTPEAFAASVVRVLRDAAERRRLEEEALASASNHDWAAVAEQFEAILARAVADSESSARVRHAARAVA